MLNVSAKNTFILLPRESVQLPFGFSSVRLGGMEIHGECQVDGKKVQKLIQGVSKDHAGKLNAYVKSGLARESPVPTYRNKEKWFRWLSI